MIFVKSLVDHHLCFSERDEISRRVGAATCLIFSPPLPNGNGRPGQVSPTESRKGQKRVEAEQRQARSRKRQEIQKRITALEKEIAGLEKQEKELTAELEKPESYAGGRAMQINRELMHIHDRLPLATAEWEATATELAQFEAGVKD